MIRMIMVWAILSVAIGLGIAGWRTMTGKEKWHLTKIIAYGTMCSLVAVVLLSFIVILF